MKEILGSQSRFAVGTGVNMKKIKEETMMFKNLFNNHDRISVNEMATAAQIGILDTFIFVFNKTAEGVRYYENCTPEQDAKCHIEAAENVIYVLNNIKNLDTHVWRILKYRYKDEIKECEELVGT